MDITISNGQITAIINPKGAELNSLKNEAGTEFIWEGDAKYWGKHSPILFPIVGTLKNNSYLCNGQIYALTRHGFARDNTFTVKDRTENSVTFSLSYNDDTLRVYPFKFELELAYIINDNVLHLNYSVINTGSGKMPFSIGAHPAFALPGNFENYSLKFENDKNLVSTMLEDDLLSDQVITIPTSNGMLPLNYSLFENDALIFKSLQSKEVTIAKDGNDYIKVSFADFPHLGIWTKKGAPFLCIEPWQGYSDLPNTRGNLIEKEGVVVLDEGEWYKASFAIEIIA